VQPQRPKVLMLLLSFSISFSCLFFAREQIKCDLPRLFPLSFTQKTESVGFDKSVKHAAPALETLDAAFCFAAHFGGQFQQSAVLFSNQPFDFPFDALSKRGAAAAA